MNVERLRLFVDGDCVQTVEPLLVGWFLEPLACHKDGDIGDTVAPLALPISAKGDGGLRRKKIAGNLCAVTSRYRDNGRPILHAGIGVVDDDGASGGEGGGDQLFLAPLRVPVMAHGILADMLVTAGKPFAVERRLAGRG